MDVTTVEGISLKESWDNFPRAEGANKSSRNVQEYVGYLAANRCQGRILRAIQGSERPLLNSRKVLTSPCILGMASPLLGIAAVNSLLFTAYGVTRRIISPYPDLTMGQIALAGAGAGAINAVLASPVRLF